MNIGRHSYHGNIELRYEAIVEVGKYTSIASGVIFMGSCQHPQTVSTFPFYDKWNVQDYPASFSRGIIKIGSDCWIGENALIMDRVYIGNGAIIGTGSVVTKHVPSYSIVGGNPAQVIKYRFTPEEIEQLQRIAWWDWPDEKVREALPLMNDITKFIETYKEEPHVPKRDD
jgi:virginiamycin A acetyltransferase